MSIQHVVTNDLTELHAEVKWRKIRMLKCTNPYKNIKIRQYTYFYGIINNDDSLHV